MSATKARSLTEAVKDPDDYEGEDAIHEPKRNKQKQQWVAIGDNRWRVAGKSRQRLAPGVYIVRSSMSLGTYVEEVSVEADTLHMLPNSAAEQVIAIVETFWGRRDHYVALGQLFKRHIHLYGPPGTGKSVAVQLACRWLIERDCLVLFIAESQMIEFSLEVIRSIEPDRPIVVVLEELDKVIKRGESALLQILDGHAQFDNVVYLSTTNHIEKLPATFTNRPSRINDLIYVGLPDEAMRYAFLQSKTPAGLVSDDTLREWAAASEGLTPDHLKELVTAVYAFGGDYREVIERLKGMKKLSEPVA